MPEFDPTKYLSKIGSADYLEVKWRLLWLRTEYPHADIDTQLMSPPDTGEAIFKARISIPNGGAATGWGSETHDDFRDYLEKAETKALGRALAALGFGTQFTPDHDFGGVTGKVVDAPVTKPIPPPIPARSQQTATNVTPLDVDASRMKRLHAVAKDKMVGHEDLHAIVVGQGKASLKDLTPMELDKFTNWLERSSPSVIQVAIDSGRQSIETAK